MAKKKKFFSAPKPEQTEPFFDSQDVALTGGDFAPLDLFADENAAADGFAALMQPEDVQNAGGFGAADGQQNGDFFGAADGQQNGDFFGAADGQQSGDFFGAADGQQNGDFFGAADGQQGGDFFGAADGQQNGDFFGAADGQQNGDFFGAADGQQNGDFFGAADGQQSGDFFGAADGQQNGDFFGAADGQQSGDFFGAADGQQNGVYSDAPVSDFNVNDVQNADFFADAAPVAQDETGVPLFDPNFSNAQSAAEAQASFVPAQNYEDAAPIYAPYTEENTQDQAVEPAEQPAFAAQAAEMTQPQVADVPADFAEQAPEAQPTQEVPMQPEAEMPFDIADASSKISAPIAEAEEEQPEPEDQPKRKYKPVFSAPVPSALDELRAGIVKPASPIHTVAAQQVPIVITMADVAAQEEEARQQAERAAQEAAENAARAAQEAEEAARQAEANQYGYEPYKADTLDSASGGYLPIVPDEAQVWEAPADMNFDAAVPASAAPQQPQAPMQQPMQDGDAQQAQTAQYAGNVQAMFAADGAYGAGPAAGGFDPNAGFDPSAGFDANAGFNANAGFDANAGFAPNAGFDGNADFAPQQPAVQNEPVAYGEMPVQDWNAAQNAQAQSAQMPQDAAFAADEQTAFTDAPEDAAQQDADLFNIQPEQGMEGDAAFDDAQGFGDVGFEENVPLDAQQNYAVEGDFGGSQDFGADAQGFGADAQDFGADAQGFGDDAQNFGDAQDFGDAQNFGGTADFDQPAEFDSAAGFDDGSHVDSDSPAFNPFEAAEWTGEDGNAADAYEEPLDDAPRGKHGKKMRSTGGNDGSGKGGKKSPLLLIILLAVLLVIIGGIVAFVLLKGKKPGAASSVSMPSSVSIAVSASSSVPEPPAVPPIPRDEWYMKLANKSNVLSADFTVDTAKTSDGIEVDARIVDAVNQMVADAKAAGMDVFVNAGYRSYATQETYYKNQVSQQIAAGKSQADAEAAAAIITAPPGASEHNLGLAVDVLSKKYANYEDEFATSAEAQWLAENAANYGFILRYPQADEAVTGFTFEPWHFRYVGVDQAQKIKASGLCLENYLMQDAPTGIPTENTAATPEADAAAANAEANTTANAG